MSGASRDDRPGNGDVIVKRATDASGRYTLGTARKPAQFTCRTREEAVTRACGYAQAQGVHAWYTEDGRAFTPVRRAARPAAECDAPVCAAGNRPGEGMDNKRQGGAIGNRHRRSSDTVQAARPSVESRGRQTARRAK